MAKVVQPEGLQANPLNGAAMLVVCIPNVGKLAGRE
jgi:hypothetical protein